MGRRGATCFWSQLDPDPLLQRDQRLESQKGLCHLAQGADYPVAAADGGGVVLDPVAVKVDPFYVQLSHELKWL